MALIRATHAVYGTCLVPAAKVALHPEDWTVVDEHQAVDTHQRPAGEHSPGADETDLAFEDPQTPAADGAGPTTSPAGDVPGQNQED